MTVLVVAPCYDLHADAVVDRLPGERIRIDPNGNIDLCVDSESADCFLSGSAVSVADISGVLCRCPLELPPVDTSGDPVANYRQCEELGALRGILLAIPADRWINYPWYENAADGKIQPLLVAKQVGLSVPPFIVTNNLVQLDLWCATYGDDLIIKPITDTAIARQRGQFVNVPDFSAFSAPYTARFDRQSLSPENIDATPFLIQKKINKVKELRVVVIDETVFVTETTAGSDAPLDIRLKSERVETKSALAETDCRAVLALRSRLNLRFMTLDFAVDESGVPWLLDVNPQGNWLWQEQQLSLGIADHIADSLMGSGVTIG